MLTGVCGGIGFGSCRVDIAVEVPRDLVADVTVSSTAGEIDLRSLAGDVDVRTTAGAVRLLDCSGSEAALTTTAGRIEVDADETTRSPHLQTTAGWIDVAIVETEALRVVADTTVGSASIAVNQDDAAEREVVARTTAGQITVRGR